MRKKVTVVGAGNVGANCALRIADKELADVVLVDVVEGVPQGKALDLLESGPILGYDCSLTGSNGYVETQGSDIVVITAGIPRKPGETRLDLLRKNVDLMKGVLEELGRHSRDYYLVMVANPVDVLTYQAARSAGLPTHNVIGTGTLLDTVRFRSLLGQRLNVAPDQVYVYMLGEHGDSMAPWTSRGF